jgi:glycosyltransferase involved in cell wall biosynthesis
MRHIHHYQMKNTHLVAPGQFWNLARLLMKQYGAPKVKQYLTLYVEEETYQLKITIDSEEMRWHWVYQDECDDSKPVGSRNNRRPWKALTTTLENLKAKLVFIASHYSEECIVSKVLSYSFIDRGSGFKLDLRPATLVGDIVAIESPVGNTRSREENDELFDSYESIIKEYITKGLEDAIAKPKKKTRFARRRGSGYSLCKEVTDFCRQNGIANAFLENARKEEILQERINDYTYIEEYFKQLTGIELVSEEKQSHVHLNINTSVSIIIPYFNSGPSIHKLLLAIQAQSVDQKVFKSLEVIVVDDGSSDPVSNYVKAHDFPFRIQIITLSINSGAADARQLGVKAASGEILIFMDSDILLPTTYLSDHMLRNLIIANAVFVSFKEDVEISDPRITDSNIVSGLQSSNYQESRTHRDGVNILVETNYFKDFHGSKAKAGRRLSSMVIGHNFSLRRRLIEKASPFSKRFKGWGYEDEYHGLQLLLAGAYVIPVLSSSVYHINHEPRSGSESKKRNERTRNKEIIQEVLQEVPSYTWVISPE